MADRAEAISGLAMAARDLAERHEVTRQRAASIDVAAWAANVAIIARSSVFNGSSGVARSAMASTARSRPLTFIANK